MHKLNNLGIVAALSLLIACFPAYAQQTDVGNVTGSVVDSSGAAVPDAKVEAVNSATGVSLSATSTSGGIYFINLLPVGQYTVKVTKPGFQKESRPALAVIAGQTF
jgi:hypothetical protein